MHVVADPTACQVFLNGERVPVKTFQDYVNLYLGPGTQRVYEKLGDRWEVCISLAEQGQFQQASTHHIVRLQLFDATNQSFLMSWLGTLLVRLYTVEALVSVSS